MHKALMLATLASLALLAPTAANACSGNVVHYTMDGAEGFELRLEKAKVPLAWSDFDLFLKTPTRVFRYSLTASNGYSYNYIAQEEPALPAEAVEEGEDHSYRIYLFDAKMNVGDLPQTGNPAPDFIFIPDLGGALYYGSEPREFLPIAMWRLKDCG